MIYMSSFNLNDYETVAQRVVRFQKLNKLGRIHAEVVSLNNEKGEVLAKAQVWRDGDIEPSAIDYAFGVASTYNSMMRKFYVEDTLTSAVGRALSLILEVTHKPTREDMSRVDSTSAYRQTAAEIMQVTNPEDPWTIKEVKQADHTSNIVENIIEVLDGTVIQEVPMCKCGREMKWSEGQRKSDGKPWAKYQCSIWNKNTGSGCDSIAWYEVGADGKWKAQKKWSN